MTTTVQKWGNSIALRLPKSIAQAAKIERGTTVHLHVVGGKVVIAVAKKPKLRLKDLLAGMKPENLHGETDWGPPVGKEIW